MFSDQESYRRIPDSCSISRLPDSVPLVPSLYRIRLSRTWVGVHLAKSAFIVQLSDSRKSITHLPLSTSHGDVDESAGISYPLLGAALGGLLLLLGLNLCDISLALFVTRIFVSAKATSLSSSLPDGCFVLSSSSYCHPTDVLRNSTVRTFGV
jgi:hypothetical protein